MPKSIKELSISEVEQVVGGATQVGPEINDGAPVVIGNDSTASTTALPGYHKHHKPRHYS
jgi:hypothetical protein